MISIVDLGYFILFALLATLIIYLIITLKNVNEILVEAKKITVDNEKSMQQTLENISAITKNMDQITADVNQMSTLVKNGFAKADRTFDAVEESIKGSVGHIRHNVEDSVGNVKRNVDELASYIRLITRVLESIAGIFGSKK